MSIQVPPWLSHLRCDRRGLPVPFVNRWGKQEKTELLSIRWDRTVDMAAVFYDDNGETEPDFNHQNMQRQRQCMAEGLCQVCGRPVPFSRRTLVLSGISTEQIQLGGRGALVVTEPWLCRRCAMFATTYCPALIRRRHDEDLQIISVTTRRQFELTVSRGWVDGPLEAESRRVQPAMWTKVLLRWPALAARQEVPA